MSPRKAEQNLFNCLWVWFYQRFANTVIETYLNQLVFFALTKAVAASSVQNTRTLLKVDNYVANSMKQNGYTSAPKKLTVAWG